MMLSHNHSLYQLTFDHLAIRNNISNQPTGIAIHNLKILANQLLEPLALKVGKFQIVSCFRSHELAKLSNDTDDHSSGCEVDIRFTECDHLFACRSILNSGIEFDLLRMEYVDLNNPTTGWLHIQYNEHKNRRFYQK